MHGKMTLVIEIEHKHHEQKKVLSEVQSMISTMNASGFVVDGSPEIIRTGGETMVWKQTMKMEIVWC